MNQYKRLLSNTVIFAVGTFSSKILVILMLRFYTGMMTTDEMGIADLIIKTTSILYPVVSLSIGQAVIRYGLERGRRKADVFTIGLATVLIGFVIALPFHPLLSFVQYNTSAGAAGSLVEYRWLIYLYVFTSCTQNVCGQFIRALGYVRLYAIDGIFRTLVTILLNILYLTVFDWNIFGYVFSIICADALSTICLFLIAALWKFIRLRRPNFHLWRSMLAYALPLVPDAILVYIIGFSDQAFLAAMQDTSVSAIYSIAYRVPTLIALVASIFVDAWQISIVNDNSRDEQIRFFSNVGNTYSSIVFIIVSGGILSAKATISVLAVPDYYIGWTFIPILALGAGFNCLSSFQKSVYLLEKRTIPSFLSTAFSAGVNIALNAMLIPHYGGTGAAIATLVSYVALFVYRAIDSRRFMPVQWQKMRLTATVLLTTVQAIIMLLEPPLWLLWQVALFVLVFLLNCHALMAGVNKLLHRA
nr:polysaccharide biosynthesis C-terminal domain-containing protein [uncultured Agathobaculum sp.]